MPADDDEASGPPPHPLDRVWFHPSELGSPVTALRPQPAAPRVWIVAALALLVGIFGTLGVVSVVGTFGNGDNTNRLQRSITTPVVDPDHIAMLVQSTGRSIVTITMTPAAGGDPIALGSGVAINDSGILTAAHLLSDQGSFAAVSVSGQVAKASVVGVDPQTDLALLKVDGVELTPAQLSTGTGSTLRGGKTVVALGTGTGSHRPVALGVISDLNQFVTYPSGVVGAAMVTTDAKAGNPMEAGGALLDADSGAVLGILTGDGAAVPIDVARNVAGQLTATGQAVHGWLGVVGDPALDRQGGGIRVKTVVPDSPATTPIDLVGTPAVQPGDVITAVGDVDVASKGDLVAAVRRLVPGSPVDLAIVRADKLVHVQVPALGASQALAADLAIVA